ncbi:MAG: molybdopterin dinucleotide binding domain-containing protein, partial [Clostridiales bacterium]|nr:molybdopterin dinucleotide binding domain-containing protein [Clostridiales bacterium]
DASVKKAYLYMNTKMAEENRIKELDKIRVYSVNGQDAEFTVKITDNVQYEELFAPIHYIECNKMTPSLYDSYSKEPSYKATPVRFEKV